MRNNPLRLVTFLLASSLSLTVVAQEIPEKKSEPELISETKEKVLGIGGLFFRAKDPKAVAAWYHANLGINLTPSTYEEEPWIQETGPTVFAPFKEKTEYFGKMDQQWMVNFRVRDLDAMVAQLRKNGNEVKVDPTTYPNGRFARVHDPEGNPIQLWEEKKKEGD